jgi:hypothetical protein
MLHYIGFDNRQKMRLVYFAGANQGIRVVDYRDPQHPKEIAYYKAPNVATTRAGENDFTRPDPRYDPAACLIYTGWNQGGLRVLELTNPAYNECMRRTVSGGGFLGTSSGRGNSRVDFEVEAKRDGDGIKGRVELKDSDADVRIRVRDLTVLNGVRDACGGVLPAAGSVQLEGTGTFNDQPATFRICVQDNGEGKNAASDLFHVACTSGCTYSKGGALSGGNLQVRQPRD